MNAPDDDPYLPPKGEIRPRRSVGRRTRAQRAFDGCMVLFGVLVLLPVPLARWPAVLGWLAVPAVGAWLFAAGKVLRAWGDADGRVLRWSSLGVLLFAGMMVCALGAAFLGLFSGPD